MCLCFFGSREAVAPDTDFDPSQHLYFQDVTVDNIQHQSYVQVRIEQSKADPFRVHGSKGGYRMHRGDLCPVASLLAQKPNYFHSGEVVL